MTGAPAERDYAVEWGAGGVMYRWMCMCRYVCRSLEKIQALAELGTDGHASMLGVAVQPDIRCHPVAIHLL